MIVRELMVIALRANKLRSALTMLGLIIGVAAVIVLVSASRGVRNSVGVLANFDPTLTIAPILVAFGISLAIGVLAGGYPAWRASQLNPIEALRYE